MDPLRFPATQIICLAVLTSGCPSAVDDGCRPVAAMVDLIFSEGSASLASVQLAGPCAGVAARTACEIIPACNGLRTEDCPCHVQIAVRTETAGTCQIDVTSPSGETFHADVVVTGPAAPGNPCSFGMLADPSQSMITVRFSGGDGGI